MLDLHNIFWVIPGVIFISIYNRRRPERAINLSGWQYIFSLVVIASVTWFPAEFVATEVFEWSKTCDWVQILFEWVDKISNVDKDRPQQMKVLILSVLFTFFWLLLFQWGVIVRIIFPPLSDNFYNKCIEWENEEVLLTLRNEKAYHGILWKYPENPRSRYESQTISIIPFKSGYRDDKTKEVKWNIYYPEYENFSHFTDMEIVIPRSEIITFGKFSGKTFEHFEKQHSQKNTNT